jgi:hypothetical protein
MAKRTIELGDVVFLKSDLNRRHPMSVSEIRDFSKTPDSYFEENPRFELGCGDRDWTEKEKADYRSRPTRYLTQWFNSQSKMESGNFSLEQITSD